MNIKPVLWVFFTRNVVIFMPEIGTKLKNLRGNASQAEFAEKLGLKTTTYQNLENGNRDETISYDEIENLARKLGISVFEFLPNLPAINTNQNKGNGGAGIVMGDLIYNASTDETAKNLTQENILLQEKLHHSEEKIRLLEEQITWLKRLLPEGETR